MDSEMWESSGGESCDSSKSCEQGAKVSAVTSERVWPAHDNNSAPCPQNTLSYLMF